MSIESIDPKLAADSALTFASQADLEHLKSLAEGGEKNLERIASRFESIFLGFLVKQMWESVDKSELLPESPGRQVYDGLLTTMLADHLAENGGVGIAKALVSQLKQAAQAVEQGGEGRPGEGDGPSDSQGKKEVMPGLKTEETNR